MKLSSSLVTLSLFVSALAVPTDPTHQCVVSQSGATTLMRFGHQWMLFCHKPAHYWRGELLLTESVPEVKLLITIQSQNTCADCVSNTYDPVSWDWNLFADAASDGSGATDGGEAVGSGNEQEPDPPESDPDDHGDEC
ncbi:hypothetical protein FB451DRAFT_1162053 [Mycena latifolia]|nr:hypothetical protein FB451DRAFT_1162053 [Mycena latifolia]